MADTPLVPQDAGAWQQFVANFDATKNNFNAQYQKLLSQQSYVYANKPDLKPQYDTLVKQGASNLNTLQFLQGVKNSVASWLSNVQSGENIVSNIWNSEVQAVQSGISTIKNWFGLNGLGLAPIVVGISVVAASAALALIVKWTTDAYNFSKRIDAEMKLVDKGYTPQAAANTVNSVLGAPQAGLFGIPWSWILIGGAVLIIAPLAYKMVRK